MNNKWNDSLAVGHGDIDEQHKALFEQFAKLKAAIDSKAPNEVLSETLSFIGDYVAKHFETEETLMEKHGYPDIMTHKAEHMAFRAMYKQHKKNVDSGNIQSGQATIIYTWLVHWLNEHIGKTDKSLGEFVSKKAG
ncbi:MAG: bacteriohemerythrin [Deltaproteobacteria bacterium]|nr:bacteriohemerythrin [Deltaproteobacteria bacterium]